MTLRDAIRYEDAHVTLYQGDCREILPMLSRVSHVITDPPYEAEAHTKARRTRRGVVEGGGIAADYEIDFPPIDEATRRLVAGEFARLSRGWILAFCQAEAFGEWRRALVDAGARWMRAQAWVKPDGTPQLTGDRPSQGWEGIATAWAGEGQPSWNGGGRRGVYTHLVNGGNHTARTGLHPTEKPLTLMVELVELFTNPGDTILDAFAGSGTTGCAARLCGRRAILIERESKACDDAVYKLSRLPTREHHRTRTLALAFDKEGAR